MIKLKCPVNFPFLVPLEIFIILAALGPQSLLTFATENGVGAGNNGSGNNGKNNQSSNGQNQTNSQFVRSSSPPPKSLFSSQLFPPESVDLLRTLTPYPLRESYIAFEQAHPIGTSSLVGVGGQSSYDQQFFKPSKFPPQGYEQSDYYSTRLENNYPPPPPATSPHYGYAQQQHQHQQPPYFLPLAPPPPPPPFLRLVRIPGELKVTLNKDFGGTNVLEILCEFPGYLLIVQQIYWHVIPPPTSPLLPYGTFYDSRDGFAPRVKVIALSKWKSLLRVQDYTPDDFGTYRCVSTAILPDDPEPNYNYPSYRPTRQPQPPPSPPSSYLLHFPHEPFSELRSSASTIPSSNPTDHQEHGLGKGEEAQSSVKRERRIKFLRNKREIGAFGVFAPFFKPHYGIYRVFKEVKFYGGPYGAASEIVENTVNGPGETERGGVGGGVGKKEAAKTNPNKSSNNNSIEETKLGRTGRRKLDYLFNRKSKVLW